MFDELDNNNATPSAYSRPLSPAPVGPEAYNQAKPVAPAKAEDIFAEVDRTGKPEVFSPKPGEQPRRGTVIPPETGWKKNKMLVLGLLFGGLIVVLAGGYLGLKLAFKGKPVVDSAAVQEQPINTEITNQTPAPAAEVDNTPSEPILPEVTPPSNVTPPPVSALDSDQDGLTDEEEAKLGTNPNNSDTDGDGLTDREEVKVYGTDPLKSDTDGDGYKDGAEVKNGYNPKGPGRLNEIPNFNNQ